MPETKLQSQAMQQDGWEQIQSSLTYASATTINSSVDLTGVIQKGDKLKLNNTTTKYFYVLAVTSSLITVTGGSDYSVANSAITLPYFSKIENPQGFPVYFNYTPTVTSGTGTLTTIGTVTCRFKIVGNQCFRYDYVTITNIGTGGDSIRLTHPFAVTVSPEYSIVGVGQNISNGISLTALMTNSLGLVIRTYNVQFPLSNSQGIATTTVFYI